MAAAALSVEAGWLRGGVMRSRPSHRAHPPGPQVAGYSIDSLIGRGRRSLVYLAQDRRRGAKVALKLACRARPQAPGEAASFAQEFAVASAIRHPNTLRVFDHGVSGEFAYLSMEHAGSGHLGERIRQGLAPYQALSLLQQAASALGQLHQRGLVHRDLKPANLLLRSCGELAVADFGMTLRQGTAQAHSPGCVVGTPLYASPEQSQGEPAQPAADVYSLGVILHEMLCGEPPFPGRTLTEVLCQHLSAPIPRLAQTLRAFQPLIDSMLAKNAADRLPDAHAVLEQVRRLEAVLFPHSRADTTQNRCLP